MRLWEDGPYWAKKNIGAEAPEDPGLYFWWGDTLGYKWENDAFVASDGSVTNYSFNGGNNLPTVDKDVATLQSEGWITYEGVLAPAHDAATANWGEEWRMPANQDLEGLRDNCDWTWTTTNGVEGCIVRGRGDYAGRSIFLPASGLGCFDKLVRSGYHASIEGYSLSSTPYEEKYNYSSTWFLAFYSGGCAMNTNARYYGYPVRPVWDPAE